MADAADASAADRWLAEATSLVKQHAFHMKRATVRGDDARGPRRARNEESRFKSVTRAMTSRADARGDGRTRDRCTIRGRRAFDARARDDERTDEDATVDRMRTTCARR